MPDRALRGFTRLLVPAAQQEDYLEAIAAVLGDLVVGDTRDPETDDGRQISRAHLERVMAQSTTRHATARDVMTIRARPRSPSAATTCA